MMRLVFLSLCGFMISVFDAGRAEGHARLKPGGRFPPRSTSSGIKTGPCGTDARTTPVVFQAGQVVTVEWEETVKHTGEFRLYFAAANDAPLFNGTPSTLQPLAVVPQDPAKPLVAAYSAQITLPSVPCQACTLQLIQVMLDNHPTAPTYYYSCADVKLTAPSGPTPTPSATPVPTATPTPPAPTVDDGCKK